MSVTWLAARSTVRSDEDWYVIQMPHVDDELTLDIEGEGYLDAQVELFDETGAAYR